MNARRLLETRVFDPLAWKMTFDAPKRLSPTSAWIEHIPFAMGLVEMMRPDTIVELGTQRGDSYCAFCQAVTTVGLPTKCFGIDTWGDDEQMKMTPEQLLGELRGYHDKLYGSFSMLIQATFDDALPRFEAGQIDLLHIDGRHDYESARHDFETWLPKMSGRGVILFHDTTVRDRENFEVWRLWEEISGKYRSFEFLHGHGLGVLAVGDQLPQSVAEFLERANQSPDGVRMFYATLGNRVAALRGMLSIAVAMTEHRRCVAQWREMTKQPSQGTADFEAAVRNPVQYTATALAEAVTIINDDLQLRGYIGQLTKQIQQLQQAARRG